MPADKAQLYDLMQNAQKALKEGKMELAYTLFKRLLEDFPDNARLIGTIGTILMELGRLKEAENHFKWAIKLDERNISCLYNLARLYQMKQKPEQALKLYEKILKIDPDFALAWNNLGVALKDIGNINRAVIALKKAIKIMPSFAPSYNNLGVCLETIDKLFDAEQAFKMALNIDKNYYPARFNLGCLLFHLERFDEAKRHLLWILQQNKNDETASFLIKCIEQKEVPRRAPVTYVEKTFDDWAETFEKKLVSKLEYSTPKKLFEAFKPYIQTGKNILDLGCGTGLGAELYRPYAKFLCGIDCSEKMLKKAREKGVFDQLIKRDILQDWQIHNKFHYIYSSDCLCYFGELDDLLKRVKSYLFSDGFFGFSVEALEDDNLEYSLRKSGRYAHNKSYLEGILRDCKYKIIKFLSTEIRKEKRQPVKGYIVIAKIM